MTEKLTPFERRHVEELEVLAGTRAKSGDKAAVRLSILRPLLELSPTSQAASSAARTAYLTAAGTVSGPPSTVGIMGTYSYSEFVPSATYNTLRDDVVNLAGGLNALINAVSSMVTSLNNAHTRIMSLHAVTLDTPTVDALNKVVTEAAALRATLEQVGSEVQKQVLP